MRTQVVIIGGGPSGLLLSRLLGLAGIETVVLERQTRDHVLSRIRAGVLEHGTVAMLQKAKCDARMMAEGFAHDGATFATAARDFRIDFAELTGKSVMVYGQTEVTKDLYDAHDKVGTTIMHEVSDVALHDIDTTPHVIFQQNGRVQRIDCAFIAGCDGFHGVSRRAIPAEKLTEFERIYPFGWMGVLSETPPVADELIYANHPRGFALASMRNENLSRYYLQAPLADAPSDWSDQRFWDELRRRLPPSAAERMVIGPSVEKSMTPLRSYVAEPMRWGQLFLCGDAAHIVPPTGAKGLNLAVSDVHYLSQALIAHYQHADSRGLDAYSETALARVWKAVRFSWWMTTTLHRFPNQTDFDQRIQKAELDTLATSHTAQKMLAEAYVGLPF